LKLFTKQYRLSILRLENPYFMSSSDQHEHAMDANVSDEGKSNWSANESGIVNGHGKSENANPDVPLQDVNDSFEISER
jgi:hypothetical protein